MLFFTVWDAMGKFIIFVKVGKESLERKKYFHNVREMMSNTILFTSYKQYIKHSNIFKTIITIEILLLLTMFKNEVGSLVGLTSSFFHNYIFKF